MAAEIVDRGRGPQLSNSRIMVLDLIPYLKRGESYDEIRRCMPILTREDLALIEHYYREHQEEMDEKDRRATAYREEQVRLQRLRFPEPEGTVEERRARLWELLEKRRQVKNGEGHPGGRQ